MPDRNSTAKRRRELEVVALRARAVAQRREVEPDGAAGAAPRDERAALRSRASGPRPGPVRIASNAALERGVGRGAGGHVVASRPAPARAAGSRCRRRPRPRRATRFSSAIVGRKRSRCRPFGPQPVGRIVRRHHEHDAVRRTARPAGGRGSSRRRCRTRGTRRSRRAASGARCARRRWRADRPRASACASSSCTSRMNAWKWTRVLRRIGTVAKKPSIRKLLPRPTPPHR